MPIVIHVGRSSDGCAYDLSPASRARLRGVPGAHPTKRVFIAFETQADYEEHHGPIEWQVAQLLTGLGRDRLEALGGVELYDPRTQQSTPLLHATAA